METRRKSDNAGEGVGLVAQGAAGLCRERGQCTHSATGSEKTDLGGMVTVENI